MSRFVVFGAPDEIAKINDPVAAILAYDLQKEKAQASQSLRSTVTSLCLALVYVALKMPTNSIVFVILAQLLVETAVRQFMTAARKRALETKLGEKP